MRKIIVTEKSGGELAPIKVTAEMARDTADLRGSESLVDELISYTLLQRQAADIIEKCRVKLDLEAENLRIDSEKIGKFVKKIYAHGEKSTGTYEFKNQFSKASVDNEGPIKASIGSELYDRLFKKETCVSVRKEKAEELRKLLL
jgi:hypothetical protein